MTGQGVGLRWLAPESFFTPEFVPIITWCSKGIGILAFVAPLLFFLRVYRSNSGMMPLICPLMMMANASWFVLLDGFNAFFWATVFHGIQYLAIVIIFHVKDQLKQPSNQHGVGFHVAKFYGMTLILAYALFQLVPRAFVFAGSGGVESTLPAFAAINIHHFIVDAYIWRLGQGSSNCKIVVDQMATI